jgi:hypothetical protein
MRLFLQRFSGLKTLVFLQDFSYGNFSKFKHTTEKSQLTLKRKLNLEHLSVRTFHIVSGFEKPERLLCGYPGGYVDTLRRSLEQFSKDFGGESHGLFKVLLQSLIGCGRGISTSCINNCCVLFSDIVVFNLEVTLTNSLLGSSINGVEFSRQQI